MGCTDQEQRPRDADPLGLYKAPCIGTTGIREPAPPVFVPEVANESDTIWRDDDFQAVVEENNSVYRIDNA